MIVSFSINMNNIKTFDNINMFLNHFNFLNRKMIVDSFYNGNALYFLDNGIHIMWELNDNSYLKYDNFLTLHINMFKKTKWYKIYMRINKLNRILK